MLDSVAVETIIHSALTKRFQSYSPEANEMPFHEPLLGKERLESYSFVHSIMTSFGTTLFEPIAQNVAETNGWNVTSKYTFDAVISSEADKVISDIMSQLAGKLTQPNHKQEILRIKEASEQGAPVPKDLPKADIYLTNGVIDVPIDMKAAKPNSGEFRGFKRTLLEWAASIVYKKPDTQVWPIIGIP